MVVEQTSIQLYTRGPAGRGYSKDIFKGVYVYRGEPTESIDGYYPVFDTNACPSANGRKFGGRADIFWEISNKIGPDGQQYFWDQT